MTMPGGDLVCYGHHVWSTHPIAPECLRCGFVDLPPRPTDRCTCADVLSEGATPAPCLLHGWMGEGHKPTEQESSK